MTTKASMSSIKMHDEHAAPLAAANTPVPVNESAGRAARESEEQVLPHNNMPLGANTRAHTHDSSLTATQSSRG
jgi:hypothetical protein